MRGLKNLVPMALGLMVSPEADVKPIRDEDLMKQAMKELNQAYNVFSNVSDPELVEIAVLNIKVAEKRFDFLVRELKRKKAE